MLEQVNLDQNQQMLSVNLLGDPQIQLIDNAQPQPVHLPTKGIALIGYLIHARASCGRREIAQLLWGNRPHSAAQTNFRQLLRRVKQEFPYGLVLEDQEISWIPTMPWTCDLRQFELTMQLTRQELRTSKISAANPLHRSEERRVGKEC